MQFPGAQEEPVAAACSPETSDALQRPASTELVQLEQPRCAQPVLSEY